MSSDPFYLQEGNLYVVPITHYNLEMTVEVHKAFQAINPDCIAVEFAETMELQLLHAASRLPDLSVVIAHQQGKKPIYYLAEPCDAAFEGLRLALESNITAKCIDLDVDDYPEVREPLPDSYAIRRIGLKAYWDIYRKINKKHIALDDKREWHMAKRLKELSLSYDKVLFICGMAHVESILTHFKKNHFPEYKSVARTVEIATLTEDSVREVMAESGWVSKHWEMSRNEKQDYPDRQKLLYNLYHRAGLVYQEETGHQFPSYNRRNLMKFTRNWALITQRLLPDLFQTITAAKGCVDNNFAYEVWKLATDYPYLKNIDGLQELSLSVDEIWGNSKHIRFQLKKPNSKGLGFQRRKKDRAHIQFDPPGPFSLCSYPPEDVAVENFGDFLKKKGMQILSDESARTLPFTTSLEEGVDVRETLRHYTEKKLWVKTKGKPPGKVGSVVMIFDEDFYDPLDEKEQTEIKDEKYPWKLTWMGEHTQESDMALYATSLYDKIVGPGISRCEYGGFMMSYPPRRMLDVWHDPDYANLKSKAEVLLAAAIDYSTQPTIVYVAPKPPRALLKSWANRYGKKVVYIPIGQLAKTTLNKLRVFHVLSGRDRRDIAGEYIF